jgi:hypothetical protein
MNITTTIMTVGTALRHAEAHGVPVQVLCGTTRITGHVIGLDGEGVALYSPDEETLVIRISGISCVRMKAPVSSVREEGVRSQYDMGFPRHSPDDLSNLGVQPMPSPAARGREAEEKPVVSPYPVGHPARAASR